MKRNLVAPTAILLSVFFPLSGLTQTHVTTPPMLVRPISMFQQKEQMTRSEDSIREMIQETKHLIDEVENKKRAVEEGLQIEANSKELDRLRETLGDYTAQLEERNRLLAERDQLLADRDAEIADLNRRLNIYDDQPKLSSVQALLNSKVRDLEALQQAFDTANRELKAALDKLSRQPKISAFQAQIREKADQVKALKRQLDQSKDELGALSRDLGSARQDLNAARTKLVALPKISDLQSEIKQKSDQLKALRRDFDKTKAELNAALENISLSPKISTIQVQLNNKAKELADLRKELEKTRDDLKSALGRGSKGSNITVPPMIVRPIVMSHAKVNAPAIVAANTRDTAAVEKLLEEKSHQLAIYKAELAKVKDQLAQANVRYNTILKEYEARQGRAVSKDQVESQEMARQLQAKLTATSQNLNGKLNIQNERLLAVEISLKDKDEQLVKLDHIIEEKNQEIRLLKHELAQAKEENTGLRAELAKDDEAFATIHKNGLILRQRLKDKEVALGGKDALITEYTAQLAASRTAVQEVTARTSGLQAQLQGKDKDVASLNEKTATLQEQLHAKDRDVASLNEKAMTLRQQLQARDKDAAAFNERVRLGDQLADVNRRHIALLMQKNMGLHNRLAETIRSWRAQNSDYELRITELRRAIDQAEAQIESMNQLIARLKAQKQNIYRLLEEQRQEITQAAQTKQEQAAVRATYGDRLEQLEQDLGVARNDVAAKRRDIEGLEQELDNVRQALRDAKQETGTTELSLSMVQSIVDQRNKVNEELTAQLKDHLKSSGEELALVKEELLVAESKLKQADHDEELWRVKEMLKSSREEIAQLQILLQQKEGQIADLQKALDINSKEFSGQNLALEGLKSELEKQKIEIDKLKQDLLWKDDQVARLMIRSKEEISAIVDRLRITEQQLKAAVGDTDPSKLDQALKEAKEQVEGLKQSLNLREAELKDVTTAVYDKDEQIKKLSQKVDGSNKQDVDGLFKAMNRQIQEQKKEIGRLLDKITAENSTQYEGTSRGLALRRQVRERDRRINDLGIELAYKVKLLAQKDKQIKRLHKDLDIMQDQLNKLSVSTQEIEHMPAGHGNVVRQSKDLAVMIDDVRQQAQEVKAQSTDRLNQDYQAQYEQVSKDLESAKGMLRQCQNLLPLSTLFSLSQSNPYVDPSEALIREK